MEKDPAALIYISNWFLTTKAMKAAEKGWYMNMILYQYHEGSLPNDLEELASICDVRFSEFSEFEKSFNTLFKQMFKQKEGRLFNEEAEKIIQGRQIFKEKRSISGKIGYFIKFIRTYLTKNEDLIEFVKNNTDIAEIDGVGDNMLKQVFEQKRKLYININTNRDKDNTDNVNIENLKTNFFNDYNLHEEAAKLAGFNPKELERAINDFSILRFADVGKCMSEGYTGIKSHFLNWCNKHKDEIKKSVNAGPKNNNLDGINYENQKSAV